MFCAAGHGQRRGTYLLTLTHILLLSDFPPLHETIRHGAAQPPRPTHEVSHVASRIHPDGRDNNGRFAKGNAGGPGNPHAGDVARLRAALIESVTEDDVKVAAGQLVRLAREGSLPAIKLLFQYTLGKPTASVEQPPVAAPVPKPQATTAPRPELLKEIERTILQPGGGLPHLVGTDNKRESNGKHDDPRRR